MKRTMLAILAMTPLMMHAQVKSSAQPGSTPTLESSNVQPAAFAGIKADHNSIPTAVRVSTGVKAPVLLHTVDVDREHILAGSASEDRVVRVAMTIDESGKPTNLKVVQSTDQFTDEAILAAASQYRFKPATLNGSAVPIEMTVNFRIE